MVAVKLRRFPKAMDYTITTMRSQKIGTISQLQNLHLPCLQNKVQIEDGEKGKWNREKREGKRKGGRKHQANKTLHLEFL